ncbi:sec-independent translocase [Streptomyces sp. 12297]|uniref:sec-independent translocase n=1 Tax=Streptomyces sp. NBC_00239 TaxID=2903640 RepID=UPI002E2B46E2|nr:sec-independent translocase [Streptomyces sp. NBC_00239]
MFNDIGALELVTLVVLAVLIFGPDKLPKVIQDVTRFIRKVREFSDSAKHDIRSELGPEFKDFEFEDLNPKTFLRKQLTENEDLKEIRSSLDLRKEMNDVADAVNGTEPADAPKPVGSAGSAQAAAGAPDLVKKAARPAVDERVRFDIDAT